jgi:5-formyltetrahydrofolate cyclo-ligase
MTQHAETNLAHINAAHCESARDGAMVRADLRKMLLSQRRNTPAETRSALDETLVQLVLAWCRQHRPSSIGVYSPIKAEPDLRAAYPQLHAMGIALSLPVVRGKDQPLAFHPWHPDAPTTFDEYGIAIPTICEQLAQPEVLLIPCVGINAQRYRLGYGGGFYDRTLAQTPKPVAIGIAYAINRAEFEVQAHDVAMDLVLFA